MHYRDNFAKFLRIKFSHDIRGSSNFCTIALWLISRQRFERSSLCYYWGRCIIALSELFSARKQINRGIRKCTRRCVEHTFNGRTASPGLRQSSRIHNDVARVPPDSCRIFNPTANAACISKQSRRVLPFFFCVSLLFFPSPCPLLSSEGDDVSCRHRWQRYSHKWAVSSSLYRNAWRI